MIRILKRFGSYDVEPSSEILKKMDESERRNYLLGKELIETGRAQKGMSVDGRFMTMSEGYAMLTFLAWRDRFEKTTDEWVESLDYFLHLLREGRKWRRPKHSSQTSTK